jgi:2-furoate---CoA ligase
MGLHRAGLVPALMNPRLKAPEIVALIKQGGMVGCLVEGDRTLHNSLRESFGESFCIIRVNDAQEGDIAFAGLRNSAALTTPLNPQPDDPAFIFYTSGTTGLPKGVVIPHRAAEPRVLFLATQCGHTHGPHNRICGVMPLYHVVGFFAVFLMSIAFNGTLYLMRDFVPSVVLKQIKDNQITSLFVTPTHLDALLGVSESRGDFSTLEVVSFAGALIPDPLLARVRKHFGARLVNIYGTTEAMNSLFMANPTSGSTFIPGFYSEARVVRIGGSVDDLTAPGEEGELIVSDCNDAIFSEYLGRPDATKEKLNNGWYRTSDAAVGFADGSIQIKGRIDETIISGGENIHPHEVEAVLVGHPRIADAAAIGVPDDRWGQIVVACVVSKADVTAAELEEYLRGSALADFKRPRRYCFLESIPRNATNKIMRKALLEQITKS